MWYTQWSCETYKQECLEEEFSWFQLNKLSGFPQQQQKTTNFSWAKDEEINNGNNQMNNFVYSRTLQAKNGLHNCNFKNECTDKFN